MWRMYYILYLWFYGLCIVVANIIGIVLVLTFGWAVLEYILLGG